ncbi:MAG: ribonuclease H-like domain-containing protein [Flavobacteriales bacterium]|nr:ribonuclease H-like domain-containing protein [Flavobacteriales bacterium]
MLQEINTEYVLFLDIETVPQYPDYISVPEEKKKFWKHKASLISKSESDTPETLYERAGIYAEFGKIICISSGFIRDGKLQIKSFAGDDEKLLLQEFASVLQKLQNSGKRWYLCAHNGKEFDFPYIARRMIVHSIQVPSILDPRGKWAKDLQLLDTMELWKFGDYKNFTALDLLADIFGIPSPKDDMDGSQVHSIYYKDGNLQRIVNYCEKDVYTLCKVFLKFKGEETLL